MHAGDFTLSFLVLCFAAIDNDARGSLSQSKTVRGKKKWYQDDAGLQSILHRMCVHNMACNP